MSEVRILFGVAFAPREWARLYDNCDRALAEFAIEPRTLTGLDGAGFVFVADLLRMRDHELLALPATQGCSLPAAMPRIFAALRDGPGLGWLEPDDPAPEEIAQRAQECRDLAATGTPIGQAERTAGRGALVCRWCGAPLDLRGEARNERNRRYCGKRCKNALATARVRRKRQAITAAEGSPSCTLPRVL